MKKIVLVMTFLLAINSCSKYSEYYTKGNSIYIKPVDAGVSKVTVQKWRVGTLRKQMVSKGILIGVNFPILEAEHMKELVDNKKIDSWVIKIIKRTLGGSDILGYYYVPVMIPGRKKGSQFRIKQMKSGYFNIYYSAASISTRFENFHCPAFGHNKLITDVDLENNGGSTGIISVSPVNAVRIRQKVEPFRIKAAVLNGGKSLIGSYEMAIALYDSSQKKRMSDFILLKDRAIVSKEKTVHIKGCQGFEIPIRPPVNEDKRKNFKFGR